MGLVGPFLKDIWCWQRYHGRILDIGKMTNNIFISSELDEMNQLNKLSEGTGDVGSDIKERPSPQKVTLIIFSSKL